MGSILVLSREINCSFEDVSTFDELLKLEFPQNEIPTQTHLQNTLLKFSNQRQTEAQILREITNQDYKIINTETNTFSNRVLCLFDNFIYWLLPKFIISSQDMIGSTNMKYADVIKRISLQNTLSRISTLGIICGIFFGGYFSIIKYHYLK